MGGVRGRIGRSRIVSSCALLVYAGLAVYVVVSLGAVPISRNVVLALVFGGFLAASLSSIARLRRLLVGLAVDWLPLVLALWAYDLVRGWADGAWMPVHAKLQIELDRWIGIGSVPTVWLQQHLWHGPADIRWYDYFTWAVYFSYFFVPTITLAVLWWWRPQLFRRLAAMMVGLALAGCLTYVLYPATPPWLAGQEGRLPPVERLVADVNLHAPAFTGTALWEKGQQYANNVAAVPSLHFAYTLLVALFLFRRLRSRRRHLLWLYPLAMTFALVYAGEHYVCEILLGAVYAVVVYYAVEKTFDKLAERRSASGRGRLGLAVPGHLGRASLPFD